MQWSREHDALIARVAEGLTQSEVDPGVWTAPARLATYLPSYNTDIAACIRAAEAWRTHRPKIEREWTLSSPSADWPEYSAKCEDSTGELQEWFGNADTPAKSLAWALWKACGGVE